MLSIEDVMEILNIPLLGVIPESPAVLNASNRGVPVTLDAQSDAKAAYEQAVRRLLGENIPFEAQSKNWTRKLLDKLSLFRSPA
jgi:septum site-determining protein MinD